MSLFFNLNANYENVEIIPMPKKICVIFKYEKMLKYDSWKLIVLLDNSQMNISLLPDGY